MPIYDAILSAPMCRLGACFSDDTLTRLDFLAAGPATSTKSDSRARQLARELDAYWADPAYSFNVSVAPRGTPFQARVWHALASIPSGQPMTYGALAKQLDTAAMCVAPSCITCASAQANRRGSRKNCLHARLKGRWQRLLLQHPLPPAAE